MPPTKISLSLTIHARVVELYTDPKNPRRLADIASELVSPPGFAGRRMTGSLPPAAATGAAATGATNATSITAAAARECTTTPRCSGESAGRIGGGSSVARVRAHQARALDHVAASPPTHLHAAA